MARRPPGESLPPIDQPESSFPSRRQYLNARARAAGYESYSAWLRARREAGIPPKSGPRRHLPREAPMDKPRLTAQQVRRAQQDVWRQWASLEDVRRGKLRGPEYWEPRQAKGNITAERQRRWAFSRLRLLWASGQLGDAAYRQLWRDLHRVYDYRDLRRRGFPGMTSAQVERRRQQVRRILQRLRAAGVLPREGPDLLPFFYH